MVSHNTEERIRDWLGNQGNPSVNNTPDQFVFKYCRDVTKSSAMNVDGSTPVEFFVSNPFPWVLYRLNLAINDNAITSIKFGGITALTNGLLITIQDDSDNLLFDFLDGDTIKANRDFIPLAGVDMAIDVAASVGLVKVRWTIERAGKPMYIGANEKFSVLVQDNVAALDYFKIMVQGIRAG